MQGKSDEEKQETTPGDDYMVTRGIQQVADKLDSEGQ